MNTKALLATLLFSLPTAWAGVIGDINFGDTRAAVTRKLPNLGELKAVDDAEQVKKLVGSHRMVERVAHQDWLVSFQFARSGGKLVAIHVDGMEGIPLAQFDGPLKSFYLYVTNAVKDAYSITEPRSENTPSYSKSPDFTQGKRAAMHIYDIHGTRVTMTLRLNLKTNLVYVGYTLTPVPDGTALGSTELPNNKGSEEEWKDIPNWDSLKEALEFLYKNGLKERPKPKPVEPVPAPEPKPEDHFAGIDSSLSSSDQALLKGIVLMGKDQPKEAAQFFAQAAREDTENGRAFYQLAICFELGTGVEQDIEKSAAAYMKAAQLGYAPALVRYAPEYKTALSELELTPEEGKAILDKAHQLAGANSVWGRYNLATLYRYGYGVRKDVEKARSLYRSLADQGDEEAKEQLKKCP